MSIQVCGGTMSNNLNLNHGDIIEYKITYRSYPEPGFAPIPYCKKTHGTINKAIVIKEYADSVLVEIKGSPKYLKKDEIIFIGKAEEQ